MGALTTDHLLSPKGLHGNHFNVPQLGLELNQCYHPHQLSVMGSHRVTSCHWFLWSPGLQPWCPCFCMRNSPGSPVLKLSTLVSAARRRQVMPSMVEYGAYVYKRWECNTKVSKIYRAHSTHHPSVQTGLVLSQSSKLMVMWHKQHTLLSSLFTLSKRELYKHWLLMNLQILLASSWTQTLECITCVKYERHFYFRFSCCAFFRLHTKNMEVFSIHQMPHCVSR